jgi:hypothetical protein
VADGPQGSSPTMYIKGASNRADHPSSQAPFAPKMLNLRRKSSTHQQPDYALDRLKVEQIVVTERYCRDSAQWQKMRTFWHPDNSKTKIKMTWFNGPIDEHIAGSKDMAEKGGLTNVKQLISPVDVNSIHSPI